MSRFSVISIWIGGYQLPESYQILQDAKACDKVNPKNDLGWGTTMILRNAHRNEAASCYQCIEDARAYHSSLGFVQWHPGYPTLQTIEDDITKGVGFVFEESNEVLGYCCIIIGDEPAYHVIDGAWKTDRPYAVVHRMAFSHSSRGKGLAGTAFSLIKEFCVENGIEAIRIDTQEENKVMQHLVIREGFQYCGLVTFDGGPKLAYEWNL